MAFGADTQPPAPSIASSSSELSSSSITSSGDRTCGGGARAVAADALPPETLRCDEFASDALGSLRAEVLEALLVRARFAFS